MHANIQPHKDRLPSGADNTIHVDVDVGVRVDDGDYDYNDDDENLLSERASNNNKGHGCLAVFGIKHLHLKCH